MSSSRVRSFLVVVRGCSLVLVLDWGVPIIVDDALVFELALDPALALHETEVRAIGPNFVSFKNSRYCSS